MNSRNRCPLAVTVAVLVFSALLSGQEAAPAQPTAQTPGMPNTKESLTSLLNDWLTAVRVGDQKKLEAYIANSDIPNYEQWFLKMYEQDKAESWIEPYGKNLASKHREMKMLIEGFANDKDGHVEVRSVNENPTPGRGMEWGMLHSAKFALDIYSAVWKSPNASNSWGDLIGYFYYIDGGFRWDSLISLVKVPTIRPTAPMVTYSPEPNYTELARKQRLEGVVVLLVVVKPDGTSEVLKVQKSLGLGLDEEAIEAVKKWRFKPAMREGKSVAALVNVAVNFRLGR